MTTCPGCCLAKPDSPTCPHCGYDDSLKRSPLVLPHHTPLNSGRYRVGRLLGKPGGFGLTYLGWDERLQTKVAIKEYLPRELAGREPDRQTVAAHSHDDAHSFAFGLGKFLEEARTLARLDHPNLVRVRDFFEENGTAYLVMDYYDGLTLGEYLTRQPGGRIPEAQAIGILLPILDGLREVHAKGFLHRDIKPANIYLTAGNRPILLDFGAARQAMGEHSRSLSVVLSEGYAPIEQYQRNGKQGPWTDVYGAAATLYRMITGVDPPIALDRLGGTNDLNFHDQKLSENLELAIVGGLSVDAANRYQTIDELQDSLVIPSSLLTAPLGLSTQAEVVRIAPFKSPRRALNSSFIYGLAIATCVISVIWFFTNFHYSDQLGSRVINQENTASPVNIPTAPPVETKIEESPKEAPPIDAMTQLRQFAEAGDTSAQLKLGIMFDEGEGIASDPYEAVKWYRQAAENGNAEAQNRMGVMYSKGKGVPQDIAEQVYWFRKAAEQGYVKGQYNLGKLYARGIGVKASNATAAKWYRKSADQGYDKAQYYLAMLLLEGRGLKKDPTEALHLLRSAADQGNLDAQFQIGYLYEKGGIISKDFEQAAYWYQKAAQAGERQAQNNLATLYSRGWGVEQSEEKQVYWYRKSADQGYPKAQNSLGVIYDKGIGVSSDPVEAVKWFRLSAEQGYAKAQHNLGVMYQLGRGVTQSSEEAERWFQKALQQGYKKAAESLDALNDSHETY